MIADFETNVVYCSDQSFTYYLKEDALKLSSILNANGIICKEISGTEDYFCRDFMPIQKNLNTFIQFTFQPDYLLLDPKQKQYVTDTDQVLKRNAFLHKYKIINSDIILDGGNVVKWTNKLILTDKVVLDNPRYSPGHLIDEIRRLLGVEVIMIPRYPVKEPTGHADGLVRFIDENTVLTICLDDEIEEWKNAFLKALTDANLKVYSLPASPEAGKKNYWGYINYLQVGNLIVLPTFSYNSDLLIQDFFVANFKGCKVVPFIANKIINNGGVLNCFTWNIKV